MSGPTIDFLSPSRTPRIGLVLLALGVVATAGAFWLERQWDDERVVAASTEQQVQEAQRAQRAPRLTTPTLMQRRLEQAQAELQRPFLPTLRAVESATVNPVFMLSMTIEPAKGSIKLEAEAPSFDHALAFVQVLDEGGVLRPAMLVSHEQAVNPSDGRASVKFTVLTSWVLPSAGR